MMNQNKKQVGEEIVINNWKIKQFSSDIPNVVQFIIQNLKSKQEETVYKVGKILYYSKPKSIPNFIKKKLVELVNS